MDLAYKLADALDCFWNAALDGTRHYDDATANAVMNGMVQGVAAVAARLRDHAASLAAPPAQGEWATGLPTWTTQKPKSTGVYVVRGFNMFATPQEQFEAAVLVREHEGELVCNLHESTSEDDMSCWSLVADMSEGFEWCRLDFAASPQPAPAPVQVDVLGELADEIEATYPNADASNLRAFAADAQPPAPGEAELLSVDNVLAADHAILVRAASMLDLAASYAKCHPARGVPADEPTSKDFDSLADEIRTFLRGRDVALSANAIHPSAPGEAATWRERWEGSGPQRGWWIIKATRLHNNDRVAYLGESPTSEAVSAIVMAHNAAIAALAQQRVPDAVDLGQFRRAVEFLRDAELTRLRDNERQNYSGINGLIRHSAKSNIDECDRLIALIDQQQEARGNGE